MKEQCRLCPRVLGKKTLAAAMALCRPVMRLNPLRMFGKLTVFAAAAVCLCIVVMSTDRRKYMMTADVPHASAHNRSMEIKYSEQVIDVNGTTDEDERCARSFALQYRELCRRTMIGYYDVVVMVNLKVERAVYLYRGRLSPLRFVCFCKAIILTWFLSAFWNRTYKISSLRVRQRYQVFRI